jgi:hypothetical protein
MIVARLMMAGALARTPPVATPAATAGNAAAMEIASLKSEIAFSLS